MSDGCDHPLIIHRVPTAPRPGESSRTVIMSECPDPGCPAHRSNHDATLPCRWAWRLAHGKGYNGEPFPKMRCPACAHIRRAGHPQEVAFETG
jgi:hypothetical protein